MLICPFLFLLQLFYSNPVVQRYKGNASLDVLVHFVSGGLAGMTAASATYPLDLVRTRLSAQVCMCLCYVLLLPKQCSLSSIGLNTLYFDLFQRSSIYYQGVGHAFRTICREEGFWGLYKGLGATLLVRFICISTICVWLLTPSWQYIHLEYTVCLYIFHIAGCWSKPCNQLFSVWLSEKVMAIS